MSMLEQCIEIAGIMHLLKTTGEMQPKTQMSPETISFIPEMSGT